MWRRHNYLEKVKFVARHVDGSVRTDVGLDSFQQSKPSTISGIQPVNFPVLARQICHRDAARNRQTVRVIGHRTVTVSELETSFDDLSERLASVAVDRMHLQIAAVVRKSRSGKRVVVESRNDLGPAQEMTAQLAAFDDCGGRARFGDCVFNC
jgi:hypothetical protein